MRRDTFQAIADPNRREILELLCKGKLSLNGLALHFDISRPAISKHVKILVECGLVKVSQKGRERYCEARLGNLKEINKWLQKLETPANPKKETSKKPVVKKEANPVSKSEPKKSKGASGEDKKSKKKKGKKKKK